MSLIVLDSNVLITGSGTLTQTGWLDLADPAMPGWFLTAGLVFLEITSNGITGGYVMPLVQSAFADDFVTMGSFPDDIVMGSTGAMAYPMAFPGRKLRWAASSTISGTLRLSLRIVPLAYSWPPGSTPEAVLASMLELDQATIPSPPP